MDEIVLRGMARWPNVPAVYGWLALDRRGQWLIRGSRIGNAVVRDFIGRNYSHDAEGRWFLQNGPQRVFVTLAYTPLVYRIVSSKGAPLAVEAHNGAAADAATGAWIDETGTTLIETAHGAGLIHDLDLQRLLPCFSDAAGAPLADDALARRLDLLGQDGEAALQLRFRGGAVPVAAIASRDVPRRFGFVACPAAPAGVETCA